MKSWLLLGFIATAVAVCVAPSRLFAFDPDSQSLVSVQLRLPSHATAELRLHVASIELVAGATTHALSISRPDPSVSELLGRTVQWARAAFDPGVIDSLRIRWQSAEILVGEAWTRVDLSQETSVFALDRRVEPGECLVLTLALDPDANAIDADPWRPHLTLESTDLPALGNRMFVAQSGEGSVAIVDRSSLEIVAEIGVGGTPTDLAWSVAHRRLFVSVAGRDEVVVAEAGQPDRLRRIPLRFGDDPVRLAMGRAERELAVLCRGQGALVLLSTVAFQESARISVGPRPVGMVEDPRSGHWYVSSPISHSIHVIDPATASIVNELSLSIPPGELVFLEQSGELVVGSSDGRRVQHIDPNTGATLEKIDLCGPVLGLTAQPRAKRLYVSLDLCQEIVILRSDRDLEIGRVQMPATPGRIFLDPEDRVLMVTLPGQGAVLLVNTSRQSEMRRVDVGAGPVAVLVP